METYQIFFLCIFAAAYVLSLGILACGKPGLDMYVLAVPVGVIVGVLSLLWVGILRPYALTSKDDILLAVMVTTLLTAMVAEGRLELASRPGQDTRLLARRRWGISIAQLVFAAAAAVWFAYWVVPKLKAL
ncbi:MAG: hypothetical protein EON60_11495 [Alphaproteobacteria bacterium]|nr:MAG: hypothetical protein EON60_11495 [Alphaproteobacteria bacterium]